MKAYTATILMSVKLDVASAEELTSEEIEFIALENFATMSPSVLQSRLEGVHVASIVDKEKPIRELLSLLDNLISARVALPDDEPVSDTLDARIDEVRQEIRNHSKYATAKLIVQNEYFGCLSI